MITVRAASWEEERLVGDETKTGSFIARTPGSSCQFKANKLQRLSSSRGLIYDGRNARAKFQCDKAQQLYDRNGQAKSVMVIAP
jgi:hypothetical protein